MAVASPRGQRSEGRSGGISDAVASTSSDGTDLHGRMLAVAKQIQQMMAESDDELARREKMANIVAALTPKPAP